MSQRRRSPRARSPSSNSAGVTLRPASKPLPLEEAAARYAAGESLAAIAARYQMSASIVGGRLTAAGITVRPPGGRRIPVPVEEAIGLYSGGQTMAQLAKLSNGKTFTATSQGQLQSVYKSIGKAVGYDVHKHDITA